MKRLLSFAACALLSIAPLSSNSSTAQTAPGAIDQQQLARAIKDLQEQQAAIAQNQGKIEEKLAAVGEAVRQARIFASRGGAGKR